MKNLFALLIFLYPSKFYCQQLFQDASGKTNLFLGQSPYGWISFNTSDKSGSIGYTRNRISGYDHVGKWNYNHIYGGDIKINVKDAQGNILSGGSLKPGVALSGNFGTFTDDFLKKGHYLTIYCRPSISYNQYSYIDTLVGGSPKLDKNNKVEGGLLLNVNFQFNHQKNVAGINKRSYVFAGIQTGFNLINNYSDLDDIELSTLVF